LPYYYIKITINIKSYYL